MPNKPLELTTEDSNLPFNSCFQRKSREIKLDLSQNRWTHPNDALASNPKVKILHSKILTDMGQTSFFKKFQ